MKNLLKNKVAWLVAAVLAVVMVVGGFYFMKSYDTTYNQDSGYSVGSY